MTITSADYVEVITKAIERVSTTQGDRVAQAADLLTATLQAGGVIQAFGCGHSEALAMEIAGRAGGLVPTNRIALRDIVLYGGEPTSVLSDPQLERTPGIAHRLYDLAPIKPDDAFVIASNSGVNGAVVEMAHLVKQRGHALIAITSVEHSTRVESRHDSGLKLADLADVVLDNGAPYGDASLDYGNGAVGAVSSITAALLAQQIVTEVVARLLALNVTPPVYLSDNVPGGREHNRHIEARYAGRIRRTA
ncbi:sugar isomerase domain-containing protein [Micromonospora sp. BL4]|uniref:sugar isomerase domain-containing protein n=1 Tax=Micromonospora sp. BL4 TaxID=2478710 RepID=UPI000EF5D1C5|nr:SIS domain-containing protein [Micromonospora sp. BL4]RLP92619.1 sugar isomerase domain-containing protein [Micromonospora sp. BL4]